MLELRVEVRPLGYEALLAEKDICETVDPKAATMTCRSKAGGRWQGYLSTG